MGSDDGSQGRGFASEATTAMLVWLSAKGIADFTAHIHPDNETSMRVARRQSLHQTLIEKDGDVRWVSSNPDRL
ncbi:MAG: GNAT family N-acetyltransferase [Actinomycetales bacterium]|nr:GNAT family N-acetyltransferase [Actinomycetales bacterium]